MRRKMLGTTVFGLVLPLAVSILNFSCAETSNDQHVRIVRNAEPESIKGGIPPDKQADIQLVLQQRDTMTLKCYQDVLNEKHDRAFKGSVLVMLTVEPSGQPSDVTVVGGTLNNPEVSQCLVEKIKEFEFPTIPNKGSMQYEYRFQPAY
jgi:hypothetical protein